jgi:hypothetical protein
MGMKLSIEWCNDKKSYFVGYVFRCNNKVVARCDESDYHSTLCDLLAEGYTI